MDRNDRRRDGSETGAAEAAISARPRCAAAERSPVATPMIGVISRLIGRTAPALSEARTADAAAIAALHKASFQRGWGEEEVYSLLIDKNVFAHRAMIGRVMAGFIL